MFTGPFLKVSHTVWSLLTKPALWKPTLISEKKVKVSFAVPTMLSDSLDFCWAGLESTRSLRTTDAHTYHCDISIKVVSVTGTSHKQLGPTKHAHKFTAPLRTRYYCLNIASTPSNTNRLAQWHIGFKPGYVHWLERTEYWIGTNSWTTQTHTYNIEI